MFSRKKTEAEDRKMADASDDLGIPMKPSPTARSGSQCPRQGADDPAARAGFGACR